jgi:hypothetical protein
MSSIEARSGSLDQQPMRGGSLRPDWTSGGTADDGADRSRRPDSTGIILNPSSRDLDFFLARGPVSFRAKHDPGLHYPALLEESHSPLTKPRTPPRGFGF